MKAHVILLGAPGAGKGTQAARLVADCNYKHVSTGDLLRSEIAKGSDLGNKVKSVLDKGDLVDDTMVLDLLKCNIDVTNSRYIFDGFPRTLEQVELLDKHILKDSKSLAVFFNIDFEVIVERVINRRMAPKSGEIYNLISRPPKVDGICDVSGETLIHRKDDTEEVVRNRLNVFKNAIDPIIDYYKKDNRLKVIDGAGDPEVIFGKLKEILL